MEKETLESITDLKKICEGQITNKCKNCMPNEDENLKCPYYNPINIRYFNITDNDK